jgi:hypothetical protein
MPLQSGKIDKAGEEEQGAANNLRLRELCVTSYLGADELPEPVV